jgi:class 3 adenylate cyclase
MRKPQASFMSSLLYGLLFIILIPLIVIYSATFIFWELEWKLVVFIIFMLSFLSLVSLFAWYSIRLYRTRILMPLQQFQSSLEDISEGFLTDEIPELIFDQAETGITDAFRKVIQINKMMLRNVDNLEKGYEEERLAKLQQLALTKAYERFVPHEFLGFLNKTSIVDVQHGDHVQTDMSIMFTDIRSFTSLSEQISTEENFKLLNSYFMKMEPIVKQNEGFIDKFIGDAIMALFHRGGDASVRAAVGMIEELEDYNTGREKAGYAPISIGIGINTGSLMLGIVGGKERMEGTVISDAVNTASRIEELNKRYGTSILISAATFDSLLSPDSFHIRMIDKVAVKGRSQQLLVYEVYDADAKELKAMKRSCQEQFEQAVTDYHQERIDFALEAFSHMADQCPQDQVVMFYVARCTKELQIRMKAGDLRIGKNK